MTRHNKVCNFLINCLIVLLIAVMSFCVYKIVPDLKGSIDTKQELKAVADVIDRNSLEKSFTKNSFNELKKLNSDLVGYLKFDSKIIELPVVQAKDNDYYLRRSFFKEYNEQGIPFMDAECNAYSKNVVIYGHNVYYDDKAMFSPLSFLVEQEKFEQSQTFSYYTENERIKYQIVAVYIIDIYEGFDFQRQSFASENNFDDWYNFIQNRNLIQTKETLGYNDKFMTLQTCKRFNENGRILILAKELDRENY